MPGKYDGVHSFLFLYERDNPEEVIGELKGSVNPDEGPVFFAELFEGDFRGFAHLAADSVEALGDLVDGQLWDQGVRSDQDTETKVHQKSTGVFMGPKRGSPRHCAICRLKTTQRPTTVLQAIADHFGEEPPFVGASLVVGRFKLVVELGADDRGSLEAAVEELLAIDGVDDEHKKIGFADLGEMDV